MKRLSALQTEIGEWDRLHGDSDSAADLIALALEEGDDSLLDTVAPEVDGLLGKLEDLEFQLVLSGEHDKRNAIVALHAGAGGVESQDWVQMLMRMYLRWAEHRGFKSEVLDTSPGDEAGVKSAVLEMSGPHAYGYLKAEKGVHRLAGGSRPLTRTTPGTPRSHSSRSCPKLKRGSTSKLTPTILRLRYSRRGGQVVRVCRRTRPFREDHASADRHQGQLPERTVAAPEQGHSHAHTPVTADGAGREAPSGGDGAAKGEHVSAEWGNQIRSYVLHPYRMVKDHRTGHETFDADAGGWTVESTTSSAHISLRTVGENKQV